MNLANILLMRHELLLVLLAAIIILAELFLDEKGSSRKIRILAIGLFAINTVIGFLPAETG
jgi:hypothetical protein